VTKQFGLLIDVLEQGNLPTPCAGSRPDVPAGSQLTSAPTKRTEKEEEVLTYWLDQQCRAYFEIRPTLPSVSQARRPSNKVICVNVAQHLNEKDQTVGRPGFTGDKFLVMVALITMSFAGQVPAVNRVHT
jgi:hypothetical protein